jgi:hypothetical protein
MRAQSHSPEAKVLGYPPKLNKYEYGLYEKDNSVKIR